MLYIPNQFVLKAAIACAIATTLSAVIPKSSQAVTFAPSNTPSNTLLTEGPNVQLAQSGPFSARTLSVTGNGTIPIPADQAAIIFVYSNNYYPTPLDASASPDAAPTPPPALQSSDLKMVTDALAGAGISANDISFAPEPYSNQSLRMTVRINNVSRERISTLVSLANDAATKDNKLTAGVSGIVYVARDCKSAQMRATDAAMADARAQAEALASTADVTIGELISITGSPSYNYVGPFPTSTCPTSLDEALRYTGYGITPYDPSLPTELNYSASISLTYEIE